MKRMMDECMVGAHERTLQKAQINLYEKQNDFERAETEN